MSVTIRTLHKRKQDGEKFSVLTAYDACFSRLISEAGVDAILVGDSLGNVIQGQSSTVPVTWNRWPTTRNAWPGAIRAA